jgi:hypothetical protein
MLPTGAPDGGVSNYVVKDHGSARLFQQYQKGFRIPDPCQAMFLLNYEHGNSIYVHINRY